MKSIGVEKRAEVKQLSGGWMILLDLFERKLPGHRNRIGMIHGEPTSTQEEILVMGAIEVEILGESAMSFFNICSRLIQSQRQASQGFNNLCCLGLAFLHRPIWSYTWWKKLCTV